MDEIKIITKLEIVMSQAFLVIHTRRYFCPLPVAEFLSIVYSALIIA